MFNRLRSKDALLQKYLREIHDIIETQYIPAVVMHQVDKVLQKARRTIPREEADLRAFANALSRAKANRRQRPAAARSVRRLPRVPSLNISNLQLRMLGRLPSVPRR